jgi:hypothetical protein
MSGKGRRYISYLLRLWQTEDDGTLAWRASLESAHTGERQGFASLAELCAFLEQETAPVDEDEPRLPAGDDVKG